MFGGKGGPKELPALTPLASSRQAGRETIFVTHILGILLCPAEDWLLDFCPQHWDLQHLLQPCCCGRVAGLLSGSRSGAVGALRRAWGALPPSLAPGPVVAVMFGIFSAFWVGEKERKSP